MTDDPNERTKLVPAEQLRSWTRLRSGVARRDREQPPARELIDDRTRRLTEALTTLCDVLTDEEHPGVAALVRSGKKFAGRTTPGRSDDDDYAWMYLRRLTSIVGGLIDWANQTSEGSEEESAERGEGR
ncbi:hypothetical protein [Streptomyces sp. NPDC088925]|uniref:hypothetical protein n=1 Tax=Streptomyces sp. NPDC088925 TaxID=3365914 RepID=UPI00381D128C